MEVAIQINVARSPDEAERQARGEDLTTLEALYGPDEDEFADEEEVAAEEEGEATAEAEEETDTATAS